MRPRPSRLLAPLISFAAAAASAAALPSWTQAVRTANATGDGRPLELLQTVAPPVFGDEDFAAPLTVEVDSSSLFQLVHGFGGAFTEASGVNFLNLSAADRARVAQLYFDPERGIGYSTGRLPMGSADFALNDYSLDEGCDGKNSPDPALACFDAALTRDSANGVVALMQAAVAAAQAGGRAAPRIFQCPWSPPAWMKLPDAHGVSMSGTASPNGLNQTFNASLAQYFSLYASAVKARGVPLWGYSLQNEPTATAGWPSCKWTPEAARDYLRDFLLPVMQRDHPEMSKYIHHNLQIPSVTPTQNELTGTTNTPSTLRAPYHPAQTCSSSTIIGTPHLVGRRCCMRTLPCARAPGDSRRTGTRHPHRCPTSISRTMPSLTSTCCTPRAACATRPRGAASCCRATRSGLASARATHSGSCPCCRIGERVSRTGTCSVRWLPPYNPSPSAPPPLTATLPTSAVPTTVDAPGGGPYHERPFSCNAPMIQKGGELILQTPYYAMGQFSRFLAPGTRIVGAMHYAGAAAPQPLGAFVYQTALAASAPFGVLAGVTPNGTTVLIVFNAQGEDVAFKIKVGAAAGAAVFANATAPAHSITSFSWA